MEFPLAAPDVPHIADVAQHATERIRIAGM
jgi:hypothetical protein